MGSSLVTAESTFYPSGEIAGLTDRPRLVRLGKIRLGVKKVSAKGNEYPSAVDYFVCPPEVTKVYGEKPRELDIMFPDDDVAKVAGAAYKMYTATRGKICTSDGLTAVRIVDDEVLAGNASPTQEQLDRALVRPDTKAFSRREIPCPNAECRFFQDDQCKVVMNLMFVLYKVPGIGVYQLDTGSYNSIVDVRGGIELVRRITNGRLRGVPLKLRVKPTTAYPEGKKKNVFTLELVSMEKLEALAEFGEKTLHDVFLPLTEGREAPPPHEPEEDLFTEEQRGKVIDVTPTRAGVAQSASVVSAPEKERGRSTAEVGGSSPSPRSELETTLDVAVRIRQLFDELGVETKGRGIFERAYKGRPEDLVDFLRGEISKRKPKA